MIEQDVSIGEDCVIEPYVFLQQGKVAGVRFQRDRALDLARVKHADRGDAVVRADVQKGAHSSGRDPFRIPQELHDAGHQLKLELSTGIEIPADDVIRFQGELEYALLGASDQRLSDFAIEIPEEQLPPAMRVPKGGPQCLCQEPKGLHRCL